MLSVPARKRSGYIIDRRSCSNRSHLSCSHRSRHSVCPLCFYPPESSGSDLKNADQSVLPECIALYQTVDLSLNTCTCFNFLVTIIVLNPTPLRSSDLPQFSLRTSVPPVPCRRLNDVHSPIRFMPVTVTRSEGTSTMYEAPVFPSTDQIQVGFVPDASMSSLAHEDTTDKVNSARHETL
jgi:hypothetical protein